MDPRLLISLPALAAAAWRLAETERWMPRAAARGANAWPRAWAPHRWSRGGTVLALTDAAATAWATQAWSPTVGWTLLWWLCWGAAALAGGPSAEGPRRRLALSWHRGAWRDLRRLGRTDAALWLLKAGVGLRLALGGA
jgi:hypothetical protein